MWNELIHDFCRGNRKTVEADVPLWCRLAKNALKMTQVGPGDFQLCIFAYDCGLIFLLGLKYMWVTDDPNSIYDMCACCLYRGIFKVCKWDVWACAHFLPLCHTHVWARASPRYHLVSSLSNHRLQVLVQKIAPPLWECLLLFFSLCKIGTSCPAVLKDNVPRMSSTTGTLCAFSCVSWGDFIWFCDRLSACLASQWYFKKLFAHEGGCHYCVCVLQNSPDFLVCSLPPA